MEKETIDFNLPMGTERENPALARPVQARAKAENEWDEFEQWRKTVQDLPEEEQMRSFEAWMKGKATT